MSLPIVYQSHAGQVEILLDTEHDTAWLTQAKMAQLFDTTTDNISLHLKNIYKEQELEQKATTEDFSVVAVEGSRTVKRKIKHYNLDAVISVGYRVNSKNAVVFRQWAKNCRVGGV